MKTNRMLKLLAVVLSGLVLTPTTTQAADLFVDVYVATNGNDGNAGNVESPVATLTRARDLLRAARTTPGVDRFRGRVFIRGGRYRHTATCFLDAQDSGTTQDPTLFTAYQDEKVIIDGAVPIDPNLFSLVTDATSLAKFHPTAANKIYAAAITSPSLIALLEDTGRQLSMDDRMMHVARFPNVGFSYADGFDTSGETPGQLGTPAAPVGALVHLGDAFGGDWQTELTRIQKARMIGYVSADWLKQTLRIHSVDASNNIRLMDGSGYGFGTASSVERPYVDHLLCELDEPGEWYFDDIDHKLYLWPRGFIHSATSIGAWAGPEVFNIDGANDVHIERIAMQHLTGVANGDAAVDIRSGSHNRVAGCTFRNIARPILALNTWPPGTDNGALSCDFIDVEAAARCYGGTATALAITPGSNYIENCHFRQVYSKSFYGGVCGLSGAGNRFRHNLMHNHNGQTATLSGPDHLVEYNEVFNTGIEEGDGGSFYSGHQASSLGNQFRHNFWHHIICIPSLINRAAIFSDDGDLGEVVVENVFYKAGDAVKINQGAAHEGHGNVFLDGIRGIYVINGSPTTMYNNNMSYLNTDPESGDKNNLLGRGMASFGISGWTSTINSSNWDTHISTFWRSRYPRFNTTMNNWRSQQSARKYNWFWDNVFYSNDSNVSAPSETSVSGSQYPSNLNDFEDPAILNFKYKEPRPAWAADIPFELIGLYTNEFRTEVPDKDLYRGLVAKHWQNTTSTGTGGYNPATINDRIYFNTGLLMAGLMAPPAQPVPSTSEVMVESHNAWSGSRAQPDGQWQYGYYDGGPSNFVAFTYYGAADDWIGGSGATWMRGENLGPRVGQFSMAPDTIFPAVRRWTSLRDGQVTVTVDARQLQISNNRQAVRLRHNQVELAAVTLNGGTPHRILRRVLNVYHGDTIDVEVDALGNAIGDWTSVCLGINNLTATDTNRLVYLPFDEGKNWPSGEGGGIRDRRLVAGDHSGNDHHATLNNMNGGAVWVPGVHGHGLHFSGLDEHAKTDDNNIGDGATELTVAAWFRPLKKKDNVAMLSSTGPDYFALLLSGNGAGNPVEFRARGMALTGPDQSGPVGEWTHAVGVWKSGQKHELYLNGARVATNPTPPGGTVDLDQWIVGSDRLLNGRYFEGTIDEVTIWDRALSPTEIYAMARLAGAGYATAQSPGDKDEDSLPDDWEIKHFGLISVTDGHAWQDQDGDLMSDRDELFAGTLPNDAGSRHYLFNVSGNGPGAISLNWFGIYGKDYRLESSPSATGIWTEERKIPAQTPVTSCTVTSATPQAYYRINITKPNP